MASAPMFPPPVNPNDLGRGPMIVGLTWTFTILAMTAVALRIYVRKTVTKALGWDDWIMLVAVILQVITQCTVTQAFHVGLGKHDEDLERPGQLVDILKWNWIGSAPAMLVSMLARISITILLIRLFGVRVWFKWFLMLFTTFMSIWAILILIFTWVQTTPVQGLWNIYDPNVKHWNPKIVLDMEYAGQSMYTISDFIYVLFPVIFIWKLNMATSRKVGLILLMGVSLFTMTMSILKTLVVQGSSHFSTQAEYNASLGALWSSMEQACVVIMGSVPALRAITKLELPIYITSFFSNTVSWLRSKRLSTDDENRKTDSGMYQDLEKNKAEAGIRDPSDRSVNYLVHQHNESVSETSQQTV